MSKRRRFTAEFKARVALAQLGGAQTQAEVCTQHRVLPQQAKAWRKELEENAHLAFGGGDQQQLKDRIADLERMVGRLTMQVEILKKASMLLDVPPPDEGRWPA
jgi:transposase